MKTLFKADPKHARNLRVLLRYDAQRRHRSRILPILEALRRRKCRRAQHESILDQVRDIVVKALVKARRELSERDRCIFNKHLDEAIRQG